MVVLVPELGIVSEGQVDSLTGLYVDDLCVVRLCVCYTVGSRR